MATPTNDSTLIHAAAEVGTTLAHLANRIDAWRKQRDELAAEVRQVVARGQAILAELGHSDVSMEPKDVSAPRSAALTSVDPVHASPRVRSGVEATAPQRSSTFAKAQHAAERMRTKKQFVGRNR